MMPQLVTVSWGAVFVAALVSIAIGWLWYSPFILGKVCMKQRGMKADDCKCKFSCWLGCYISLLVQAYVLAQVIGHIRNADAGTGAVVGFWLWLGFVATTLFGHVLWEKGTWTCFFIHAGNKLVSLLVMGAILASWH